MIKKIHLFVLWTPERPVNYFVFSYYQWLQTEMVDGLVSRETLYLVLKSI